MVGDEMLRMLFTMPMKMSYCISNNRLMAGFFLFVSCYIDLI